MATKPVVWQAQGLLSSLDELQSEEMVSRSCNCSPPDRKAPKAVPEEDIDVLESGADAGAPEENQTLTADPTTDSTDGQKAATQSEQVSTQPSDVLCSQREHEKQVDAEDCDFPPPPSPSASTLGVFLGRDGFSGLEEKLAKVIIDPKGDQVSLESHNSQEQPKNLELVERSQEVESILGVAAAGILGGKNIIESKNNEFHPLPYGVKNLEDCFALNSPPYADDSEEDEEAGTDGRTPRDHRQKTFDCSCKNFQPSCSAAEQTITALSSPRQEGALLPQSSHEPSPRGGNQEAVQQVFGEGPPPLSAVAMEMWDQGRADSEGCGSALAAGERRSRVGERAVGEKQQTGGQEGQKESGIERKEVVCLPRNRGLLGFSKTGRRPAFNTQNYSGDKFLQQNRHKMEKDIFDDSQSDSGVSADFSPFSSMDMPSSAFTVPPGTASTETPIEREIRRAIQREHSLRRSRGLPNRPTSPEYVEIPLRKTVLSQSLTSKSEWSQNKDREFAGKKMQQEINKEAQREHDLVKMGKIPGVYDRGTAGQLKERKQIFEAFQTTCDSTFLMSVKSLQSQSSVTSDSTDVSTLEETKSEASTCKDAGAERRPSFDLLPQSPAGGGLNGSSFRYPEPLKQAGQQAVVVEHGLVPAPNSHFFKAEKVSVIESESSLGSWYKAGWRDGPMGRQWEKEVEEEITPRENPFFKLRPSDNLVKLKQEILQAEERERELRNQRINLYGGVGEAVLAGPSSKGGTEPSAGESYLERTLCDTYLTCRCTLILRVELCDSFLWGGMMKILRNFLSEHIISCFFICNLALAFICNHYSPEKNKKRWCHKV